MDSSFALFKLLSQGFNVVAVYMDIGLGYESLDRAKFAAFKAGVPLKIVRLKEQFEEQVVKYFIDQYLSGKTPNPCAICNKRIKFGLLEEECLKIGADLFATGHYACLKEGLLCKALDAKKDQSYFLSLVPKENFENVLFPLCNDKKANVKELMHSIGITSKESQEICFLKGKSYREFMLEKVGPCPGKFVDTTGKLLGEHKGFFLYTIGQRRGLGVSVGRPLYVVKIIPDENLVVLGSEKDLYSSQMRLESMNWFHEVSVPLKVKAKIRQQHIPADAVLYPDGKVVFDIPQRAVTPGQVACLYMDDAVVAGGIIS